LRVSDSPLDWAAQTHTASTLGPPLSELSLLTADPTNYPTQPRSAVPVLQAEAVEPTPAIADPDLGILRLRRSPGTQPGDAPAAKPLPQPSCDPELGCLRLRDPLLPQPTTAAPRAPVVYLIARADYFHNSNLFSDQTPVPDGLTRPGLTLYTSPMLGPNTYAVASVTGNLLRYSSQSRLNSNELFLRAGILQRLSPTMFGEIGWSNQQLFVASDKLMGFPMGSRFFNEHAIRLELSRRDRLAKNLVLNSFYQFRYSFADPIDRSRITNALTLSLNYDLQPNLQLGLDYQLGLASFTQQQRYDRYHQVLGRLTYTPVKNTQVSAFVGYGFGNSSDPSVRFNSLLVGVSVNLTLGLF
jgi:Putative beta-barrel porin 2